MIVPGIIVELEFRKALNYHTSLYPHRAWGLVGKYPNIYSERALNQNYIIVLYPITVFCQIIY